MERRLVAILAADVAGYSHLMELDEEAATATLRTYCAVVEGAIAPIAVASSVPPETALSLIFHSIVDAIRCAVEIQHELADRNAPVPEDRRMQFRIGVNVGDVIAEENHLYGTGVNVAARLEQLAVPGGVCISQTVYDQVRKIVEMSFQDIGEFRLKNIDDPVHVYRILSTPLPWFRRMFPRTRNRRRSAHGRGVVLLLLAVITGASYFAGPSAIRSTLFGDAGVLSLPEHPAIAVLPFKDLSAKGTSSTLPTELPKN